MELTAFTDNVKACCNALRLGRQSEAGALLDPLLHTLATAIGQRVPADAAALQPVLLRTLQCQQRQDLIGLADELEYVLLPALSKR